MSHVDRGVILESVEMLCLMWIGVVLIINSNSSSISTGRIVLPVHIHISIHLVPKLGSCHMLLTLHNIYIHLWYMHCIL